MKFPTEELQAYAQRILGMGSFGSIALPRWCDNEARKFIHEASRDALCTMRDKHMAQENRICGITADVPKRRALRSLVLYPDHAHLLDVPVEAYPLLLASKVAPAALFLGIVSRASWKP